MVDKGWDIFLAFKLAESGGNLYFPIGKKVSEWGKSDENTPFLQGSSLFSVVSYRAKKYF